MELPKLPKELGYDVCGFDFSAIEKFFITHTHEDHLPARYRLNLACAPPLRAKLKAIYKRHAEIEEYTDYFVTADEANGSSTTTYGYFIKRDIGVIGLVPECINPLSFVREFGLKGLIIVIFKQPEAHLRLTKRPVRSENILDCWLADPSRTIAYAPNVIPKCVESIADVKKDPKKFWGNPFAEKFL